MVTTIEIHKSIIWSGIGCRPASADMAGTGYERHNLKFNYYKNTALNDNDIVMKEVITEMEAITDKIDEKTGATEP